MKPARPLVRLVVMATRARWLLLVAAGCGSAAGAPAAPADATASCVDDGKPYDRAAMRDRIALLASRELDGRAPGSAGSRAAHAFVIDRFRCLGLVPGGDAGGFTQAFAIDGTPAANVIGYVAGSEPGDIVVVGAHLDHLGGGKLGANDNASGVAGVLAIAQAVRQHGQPRRTIAFVLFDGEEGGLLGSSYLVEHPPAALPIDHVVEMVNLDMIGSYDARRAVYAFGASGKLPARTMLARLARDHRTLNVGIGGHSERGDQYDFCEHGIPYVFFWTPDPRCYHEACDTASRIDLPHAAEIAQLAGDLVLALADSSEDLAASRRRLGCDAR